MHASITRPATLLRVISLVACFGAAASAAPPEQGGALPAPLPLLPHNNWWNTDISAAPVDPQSGAFIAFINNGSSRKLHPDFGGDVSPGSVAIYGFPYVVVDGAQPKKTVTFQYGDESDGVDHATGLSFPFYPIPDEAITQPHWIEGGDPGNVDLRGQQDRHLLIVDRDNRYLYELYNVYFDGQQWQAGSGAFFDLNRNDRRPDGWTSADAAGLAILPGLVRYDEVFGAGEIDHAFRVTVRATNGYVYPASHRAGSNALALPMGARLRLKAGVDLSRFPPEAQKIFRAMKKYGLIVADNGSDMYISGAFDTRWNNDVLNPAFAGLSAGDFEVIALGWRSPQARSQPGDFDGDGAADIAVYRPASGTWFWLNSSSGGTTYASRGWGSSASGDVPIGGDFDGDGVMDPAVYRPSTGSWLILTSSSRFTSWTWFGWGTAGDTPVPGDYDGDGRSDGAIYRPTTGEWFIRPSSGASPWTAVFGGRAGDVPVPGDYDGDGRIDLAIYRPASGTWFILESSSNYAEWYFRGWGVQASGDSPVPGDYDGDGKTDVAVYRPGTGTWFILESSSNDTTWRWAGWGLATDQPMPADYDGDGKTDLAVYRPSTGAWWIRPSNGSTPWSVSFGQPADVPLGSRPAA